MCGIVGIAGGAVERSEIEAMLATVRHRGPDGEGVFVGRDIALGNVRLAIIDPTPAGAQPMCSPDERYTLVYNGELYNHRELRRELELDGVQFRGHSDTETLLWLLIRHGAAVLPRLNGTFGFAFHDALRGELLVARDQVGVKPIYLARGRAGRLLFASEIKALFATGEVAPRLAAGDLLELLMFHFIAGERTAFRDVVELLPGHLLRLTDGRTSIERYWSPIDSARRALPTDDPEALQERVAAAVHRQLMSDVPLGVMSSGGIDSGLVTAFAGAAGERLAGFCYREPDHGYDELAQAIEIGQRFGVDVSEVSIAPSEIPALLHQLTWHYDEPIPRPHHLAGFAVARAARARGLKVLLSGEGGDELFGGYQRYADLAGALASGDESSLVFAHNRVALARLRPLLASDTLDNPFRFACAAESRGLDPVNRELLYDQQTFLQHFLQRSDRMGLAAGVEIRVPLLDIELIEAINAQPGADKANERGTKQTLRAVARRVLSSEIASRAKLGFDMPVVFQLRSGSLAPLVDELLLDRPRLAGPLEPAGITQLVREFRAGNDELWKVLWMVLATEIWMRTFRVSA